MKIEISRARSGARDHRGPWPNGGCSLLAEQSSPRHRGLSQRRRSRSLTSRSAAGGSPNVLTREAGDFVARLTTRTAWTLWMTKRWRSPTAAAGSRSSSCRSGAQDQTIRRTGAVQVLACRKGSIVFTPGSVSVVQAEDGRRELLICNNYADNVSSHAWTSRAAVPLAKSEVLLRKWLNLPDGVYGSRDGRWIAVSNHNSNGVLLYDRSQALNGDSSPVGVLRVAHYPHGLRFSADNQAPVCRRRRRPMSSSMHDGGGMARHADAGQVDPCDGRAGFRSGGRKNPQEGGPKGIDFDRSMTVLAATCEYQPLASLTGAAGELSRPCSSWTCGGRARTAAPSGSPAVDVEYELGVLEVSRRPGDNGCARSGRSKPRPGPVRAQREAAERRAAAAEAWARAANAECARKCSRLSRPRPRRSRQRPRGPRRGAALSSATGGGG